LLVIFEFCGKFEFSTAQDLLKPQNEQQYAFCAGHTFFVAGTNYLLSAGKMKAKNREKGQRQRHEKTAKAEWFKNHPILENENGNYLIVNTSNSLQDYDDKRKEIDIFNMFQTAQQEEKEDFGEDYWENNENELLPYEESNENELLPNEQQLITTLQNTNYDDIHYNGSSILQQIDVLQMKSNHFQFPEDDNNPLDNRSFATKGEFARAFSELSSKIRLNISAQKDVLEFIQQFNPYQSLPIKISSAGNVISMIQNYVPPSNRLLQFDTCEDGCVVFSNNKRTQDLRRCPKCNLERYNQCILGSCKGVPYDNCPHSDVGREAKKILYYRPLIPLLIKLLSKPEFILALNYKFVKQSDNNYEDVQDGHHYKENYAEMDTIYEEFCLKNPFQEWTKINILISQFYDGVKVFDHKVVDFWPLLITILNLPPTLRNQTGVGTFLLSIFSNSISSDAEKYLFENCFIEELMELYKGVRINNTYFVQVRLIQHCLDTKAVGKQLNTHETNSLIGCPLCRELPGSSRHNLSVKKIVYSGFRILLPFSNILRFIGRSKLCCPPGFYGLSCLASVLEKHRNENIDAYNSYAANLNKIQDNLISDYVAVFEQRLMSRIKSLIISCVPNSEANNNNIQQFYTTQHNNNSVDPFYQWFHTQDNDKKNPYHHSQISGYIYFVHCDLRPMQDLTRRTQIEFEADGIAADNLPLNIQIADRHVNGVKGSWPFKVLPYANIKFQMCFDPFHCLAGMAKHIVSICKGERSTLSLIKYCMETKTFPFLYTENSEIPWLLSPFEQSKVDAWIDAILIPKSYSENFQIDRLFAATGYVRGKSFIDVFSILIDYFNLAMMTVPEQHKNFLSMLGAKYREILAYSFTDEKIEELHYQIIETMAVYEGLFSEKECMFLFHEFLHLSRHIRVMGPLHGWWTFSGERSMSFIKKFVPIGGRSFDKTCMNAYNKSESAITENAFRNKFYEDDVRFSINENTQQLEFDFHSFYLYTPISFTKPKYFPEFSSFEKDCLVNILLSEIFKIADNHTNALKKSSFYRLFHIYKVNESNCKSSISFRTWIFLVSLYSGRKKSTLLTIEAESLLSKLEPFIEGSPKYVVSNMNEENRYKFILRNEIKTATSIVELLEYQQNNFKIFKNAIINGNRFSARDESYAEKSLMTRDQTQYGSSIFKYKTNNEKNNLQTFKLWSMKDDHSSWCKYRIVNKNNEFNPTSYKDFYGRLNYFFRITCPTDDILHGLGMANITPRIFTTIKFVDKIPCDEYVTMTTKEATTFYLTFIPITNIYPTPILISPFDKYGLPIVTKLKKNQLRKNNYSMTTQLSYFLINYLKPNEVVRSNEQMRSFDKTKYKIYNSFSKDR
jgi:hypothetical protein